MLEFLRSRAEKGYGLILSNPRPVDSVSDIWRSAAQIATIGIFVLALGAALYACRPLLLPILTALVIGTTFAPIRASTSRSLSLLISEKSASG